MNYAYGNTHTHTPRNRILRCCQGVSLSPLCFSVLKVKVLSAHDKGSHAEVEVKVQKVLSQNTKVKIQRGRATLYPESWTARGCTCPILNPGQTPQELVRRV